MQASASSQLRAKYKQRLTYALFVTTAHVQTSLPEQTAFFTVSLLVSPLLSMAPVWYLLSVAPVWYLLSMAPVWYLLSMALVWYLLSVAPVWYLLSVAPVWYLLSMAPVWYLLSMAPVWYLLSTASVWYLLSVAPVWYLLSTAPVWYLLSVAPVWYQPACPHLLCSGIAPFPSRRCSICRPLLMLPAIIHYALPAMYLGLAICL